MKREVVQFEEIMTHWRRKEEQSIRINGRVKAMTQVRKKSVLVEIPQIMLKPPPRNFSSGEVRKVNCKTDTVEKSDQRHFQRDFFHNRYSAKAMLKNQQFKNGTYHLCGQGFSGRYILAGKGKPPYSYRPTPNMGKGGWGISPGVQIPRYDNALGDGKFG